jgi:tetrapyrrole methylase family protein/MazG family protein
MNKETFKNQDHYSYEDLLELVTFLRRECPWDKAQTHQSVRRGVIEEAYEVAEAIDRADDTMMIEELGDLMMQALFHAEIARQEGRFTLQEIYDRLCKKLIFRHPNLFEGTAEMDWQELKRMEKGQSTLGEDLEGIAKTLPALTRAEKIAGKIGQPPQKIAEIAEIFEQEPTKENLGKLLFATAATAKQQKIDPEAALEAENRRQIGNFCSK